MGGEKKDKSYTVDLYGKIEELIGIDLRALGVFRMALGAIILVDILVRFTSIKAHYTDEGVLPRSIVFEYGEQPWFLSFHMLSGELWLQVFLFLFTGVCAIALLMGYRCRVACFLCWILMLSLHVRNPFVNNLGDWLLVDLLFWSMFLPVGAKFSVDATLRTGGQIMPKRIWSIATLAILLQIGIIYFFSVRHKVSPVWHVEGTAIQFALHLDRMVTDWGRALLSLPDSVLKFATFGTLVLEKWGPVLAFFPFFISKVRTSIALIFMVFHIGLAISFELGLFPFICISAWILFLPSGFWDQFDKRRYRILSLFSRVSRVIGELARHFLRVRSSEIKLMPGNIETLITIAGLFCMISSALLYGRLMDEGYYKKVYRHVEPIVDTLNMKQRWDMFSPYPPRTDGWIIVAAYGEDGSVINLFGPGQEMDWSRPDKIAGTFKDQRWRKYMEWVMMKKGAPLAEDLARYYSTVYEQSYSTHGELTDIGVYLMYESISERLEETSVFRRRLNTSIVL